MTNEVIAGGYAGRGETLLFGYQPDFRDGKGQYRDDQPKHEHGVG